MTYFSSTFVDDGKNWTSGADFLVTRFRGNVLGNMKATVVLDFIRNAPDVNHTSRLRRI